MDFLSNLKFHSRLKVVQTFSIKHHMPMDQPIFCIVYVVLRKLQLDSTQLMDTVHIMPAWQISQHEK